MEQMNINVTVHWFVQYQRGGLASISGHQCEIYGGQWITGKSSSPPPKVLPLYPVSIIPPMLYTHILLIYCEYDMVWSGSSWLRIGTGGGHF